MPESQPIETHKESVKPDKGTNAQWTKFPYNKLDSAAKYMQDMNWKSFSLAAACVIVGLTPEQMHLAGIAILLLKLSTQNWIVCNSCRLWQQTKKPQQMQTPINHLSFFFFFCDSICDANASTVALELQTVGDTDIDVKMTLKEPDVTCRHFYKHIRSI